jgi:hypothetical protein
MRTNKYSGSCHVCGADVKARAGYLDGKRGRRWLVACQECVGSGAGKSRAGITVTRFSSGAEVYRNARGRCIDAPCCGCCS